MKALATLITLAIGTIWIIAYNWHTWPIITGEYWYAIPVMMTTLILWWGLVVVVYEKVIK